MELRSHHGGLVTKNLAHLNIEQPPKKTHFANVHLIKKKKCLMLEKSQSVMHEVALFKSII